eukprot:277276-Chlamydomonas_euryale.AAC.4
MRLCSRLPSLCVSFSRQATVVARNDTGRIERHTLSKACRHNVGGTALWEASALGVECSRLVALGRWGVLSIRVDHQP